MRFNMWMHMASLRTQQHITSRRRKPRNSMHCGIQNMICTAFFALMSAAIVTARIYLIGNGGLFLMYKGNAKFATFIGDKMGSRRNSTCRPAVFSLAHNVYSTGAHLRRQCLVCHDGMTKRVILRISLTAMHHTSRASHPARRHRWRSVPILPAPLPCTIPYCEPRQSHAAAGCGPCA